MPKLKLTDDDLDARDLEDAEYEESDFDTYDGPEPPAGTILPGYIKKVWWTWTQEKEDGSGGDPMIVVLFVADETAGEYEGCVIWERIVLTKPAKFRWAPFLGVLGLSIFDVRQKTYVVDEDENLGRPVTHISDWYPGEDKDEAYARVIVGGHRFDGRWQLDAKKWLAYEPGEAPDEEDEEEEPPARPTRAQRGPSAGRSAAPARSSRRRQEPDEDEGEEDEEAEQGGGRRGGRASSGRAAPARTATRGTRAGTRAAPARGRGRGRSGGSDQDPPF